MLSNKFRILGANKTDSDKLVKSSNLGARTRYAPYAGCHNLIGSSFSELVERQLYGPRK